MPSGHQVADWLGKACWNGFPWAAGSPSRGEVPVFVKQALVIPHPQGLCDEEHGLHPSPASH